MGPGTPKNADNSRGRRGFFRPKPPWAAAGSQSSRRRRPLRAAPGLLALILLFGGAYLAARLDPLPPRLSGTAVAADGDSLRLRGDRVRLLGIDAPELDQVCWDADGAEWQCGRAARQRLAGLVGSARTICQPDGTDRYGRTLATCTAGGRDVAAVLVAEGLAVASGGYEREEAVARSARLGIWRGRFVEPRRWRAEGPVEAPAPDVLEMLRIWLGELTGATILR